MIVMLVLKGIMRLIMIVIIVGWERLLIQLGKGLVPLVPLGKLVRRMKIMVGDFVSIAIMGNTLMI